MVEIEVWQGTNDQLWRWSMLDRAFDPPKLICRSVGDFTTKVGADEDAERFQAYLTPQDSTRED